MKTLRFFALSLLTISLISNSSMADTEYSETMVELEQIEVALGDDIYNIYKTSNDRGNFIVFQTDSKKSLLITDENYKLIAEIKDKKNYAFECELKQPVIYYIGNKEQYQQPLLASCGDGFKVREVE